MENRKLLFLCSGNYYRSRFAEIYFNLLAVRYRSNWVAFSRGLKQSKSGNIGPISPATVWRLLNKGLFTQKYFRFPIKAVREDFANADLVVAVKESEHRFYMNQNFQLWEDSIRYWEIHDVNVQPPSVALPILERQVESLFRELTPNSTVV